MSSPVKSAMILAAGLGERLRPLSAHFPKPSLPLMGRPLIEYTLRTVARKGIRNVVVNLHHLPEAVERCLDNAPSELTLSRLFEPELLGTAGGVKNAEEFLRDGTFLLLNGDTLTDFDLERLCERHRKAGARATLLLRPKPRGSRYTGIRLDEAGWLEAIERFDGQSELMFAGVWLLEPSVHDELSGEPGGLERELLPKLIEERSVLGCVQHVPWITVDTPRRYLDATLTMAREGLFEEDWLVRPLADAEGTGSVRVSGGSDTKLERGVRCRGPVVLGRRCRVSRGASLDRSLLWDDVTVEDGVSLKNVIVTDGVSLPAGTVLEEKLVMRPGPDLSTLRRREIRDGLVIAELRQPSAGI